MQGHTTTVSRTLGTEPQGRILPYLAASPSPPDESQMEEVRTLLRENMQEIVFGPKKRAAVLRYQALHRCSMAEAHEACEAIEATLTA